MGENDQISLLKDKGVLFVDNKLLENLKRNYHDGKRGITVFQPPEIGTDILLLEHYYSSRDTINTRFTNEKGFEKEWTIYHVKEYVLSSKDLYNPSNQVVLTYKVMKGPIRERRVEFRDFFSGFYYPRVLNDEEKEIVRKYRGLVDDTFSIRSN